MMCVSTTLHAEVGGRRAGGAGGLSEKKATYVICCFHPRVVVVGG